MYFASVNGIVAQNANAKCVRAKKSRKCEMLVLSLSCLFEDGEVFQTPQVSTTTPGISLLEWLCVS